MLLDSRVLLRGMARSDRRQPFREDPPSRRPIRESAFTSWSRHRRRRISRVCPTAAVVSKLLWAIEVYLFQNINRCHTVFGAERLAAATFSIKAGEMAVWRIYCHSLTVGIILHGFAPRLSKCIQRKVICNKKPVAKSRNDSSCLTNIEKSRSFVSAFG